jgi:hypothetical protein
MRLLDDPLDTRGEGCHTAELPKPEPPLGGRCWGGRSALLPHIRNQEGARPSDPTQTSALLRYSFVSIAGVIKLCP